MKKSVLAALAICASGCTSSTQPSVTTVQPKSVAPSDLTYAINIPDARRVQQANEENPTGVRISPVEAQRQYDYTAVYGGSPNVYYGDTAPQCEYIRTGIVVAPYAAASVRDFTSAQWSVVPAGVTFEWVGRFAYAAVPAAGSYGIDPTGQSCQPR